MIFVGVVAQRYDGSTFRWCLRGCGPCLEGLLGGTILGRLLSWDSRRFQSRIGRDETMKLAMVALRQPSVVRTATDVKGKTLK
mmetsp:Transcript_21355/g.39247  ORF Transcript_21355/g.39247 Transcript_21355/m.39247 type:complete len:83 (-) Transcript_21355:127-375(-)